MVREKKIKNPQRHFTLNKNSISFNWYKAPEANCTNEFTLVNIVG